MTETMTDYETLADRIEKCQKLQQNVFIPAENVGAVVAALRSQCDGKGAEPLNCLICSAHGWTDPETCDHTVLERERVRQAVLSSEAAPPPPPAASEREAIAQSATDYLQIELDKLGHPITYTACKKLTGAILALPSPSGTEALVKALPERPHSIYSEHHLRNWSDVDFANHASATRKTLQYLIELEATLSEHRATAMPARQSETPND